MRAAILCLVLAALTIRPAAAAPAGLRELLEEVRAESSRLRTRSRERAEHFRRDEEAARAELERLQGELGAEEQRSRELEARFEANEEELARLRGSLEARGGDLSALGAVLRQVGGELASSLRDSLVSLEEPGRVGELEALAAREGIPRVSDVESLWFRTQQEMTLSGEVRRFSAEVVDVAGTPREQEVVRVGVFTAVSRGRFLAHLPGEGRLLELSRQPSEADRTRARALERAAGGDPVTAVIDPTRGSLLGLLVRTPGLEERIHQGGMVGYAILLLAALGALLALERLVALGLVGRRVRRQRESPESPGQDNPLGRVLSVHDGEAGVDPEVLERRLDEAILRELPALTRGVRTLKLIASVAPLLGLLGTVIGMILTFQKITLFGTGDPRLMADGISQALVTTALGLSLAIPLVFLHRLVSGQAEAIVQVLEEESAGLLARRMEDER